MREKCKRKLEYTSYLTHFRGLKGILSWFIMSIFSVSNEKILAMTVLINRMFDVYKWHSLSLSSFSLVCSGAFCKFNPFHFLILKAINCASTFSLLSVNLQMVMPNTPSFFVPSCANANLVHSRSLNRSNVFFQKRPALFQYKV